MSLNSNLNSNTEYSVTIFFSAVNFSPLNSFVESLSLNYRVQEAGNNAATLCTGYSPVLTFEITNMDDTITQALTRGAFLDGSMKYMAVGKVHQNIYCVTFSSTFLKFFLYCLYSCFLFFLFIYIFVL